MQDVLAGWPRRKHKLLEIGCGTGLFLDHLYQMGLDVTGIDNSPEMIMAARKRFGNRAELHLAHGEHMGFSDNEFDYALLWSVLEFSDEPEAMLSAEAARVAEKGVLIGFLNKNSLYYSLNVRKSRLDPGQGTLVHLVRNAGPGAPRHRVPAHPGPLGPGRAHEHLEGHPRLQPDQRPHPAPGPGRVRGRARGLRQHEAAHPRSSPGSPNRRWADVAGAEFDVAIVIPAWNGWELTRAVPALHRRPHPR